MMDTNEVSSILVDLDGGEFGIVTDRDLRSGVVAGRLSPDDRVTALMSTPLISVSADQTGADVMLAMLDHDIRHIPVFASRSNLLGVIVGIDLVAAETRSPFVLRRAIARARDKAELREAASRLRSTVVALHRAGLTPLHVSDVVSAVTDALIRRMIDLAIETEGPPPTQFTWMSLGSHGRREPVPSSDLDSGMAWLDRPDPDPIAAEPRRRLASARTAEYMRSIASHVADCVRVIGWRLDAHGVTPSGSFAASSIEDWRRSIEGWLTRPSDNRVLIATSILLDGRVVYGPERGLDVKRLLFELGDRQSLESWMLRLALAAKPPTGFVRNIVAYGSGTRWRRSSRAATPMTAYLRRSSIRSPVAISATPSERWPRSSAPPAQSLRGSRHATRSGRPRRLSRYGLPEREHALARGDLHGHRPRDDGPGPDARRDHLLRRGHGYGRQGPPRRRPLRAGPARPHARHRDDPDPWPPRGGSDRCSVPGRGARATARALDRARAGCPRRRGGARLLGYGAQAIRRPAPQPDHRHGDARPGAPAPARSTRRRARADRPLRDGPRAQPAGAPPASRRGRCTHHRAGVHRTGDPPGGIRDTAHPRPVAATERARGWV